MGYPSAMTTTQPRRLAAIVVTQNPDGRTYDAVAHWTDGTTTPVARALSQAAARAEGRAFRKAQAR